ncbi:unnamed protein product, partial [Strongylus vulgaris]
MTLSTSPRAFSVNSHLASSRRFSSEGYGHIAPETFYGRLFCIVYGLIGVPMTLLTIADLGMFLTIVLRKFTNFIYNIAAHVPLTKTGEKGSMLSTARDIETLDEEEKEKPQKDPNEPRDTVVNANYRQIGLIDLKKGIRYETAEMLYVTCCRKTAEAIALGVTFALYLVLGAKVLAVYEPDMDFFKAFYFNFVTLTTIGLGDFVPRRHVSYITSLISNFTIFMTILPSYSFDYLYVTLCYIGVGLALTTMAIDLAADLLRKLHYVGRKMDNMAS